MGFEFLIVAQFYPAGRSCAVLEQVSPDVFLVSSKADDRFIDLCSDSSTNLPWVARYIICARPPWHSFSLSVFFFGGQWLLLAGSSRYARRRISDRRGGATTSCLWGSSLTFPKRSMIPLNPIRPQSQVMHTNSCGEDGKPKVVTQP